MVGTAEGLSSGGVRGVETVELFDPGKKTFRIDSFNECVEWDLASAGNVACDFDRCSLGK